MGDMKWWHSASIGAVGGLALAVLKLIEAKFYLSGFAPVEAYAAYLTYACYMVLGSLAATFLADHELPAPKKMRSAFVLGLLAPSVLLAIASSPVKKGGTESGAIPSLTWLSIPKAHAAPPLARPITSQSITVQTLRPSMLQPTFSSALSAAVGISQVYQPYVYVVGATPDKAKALETASKLQFIGDTTPLALAPRVVQVEGGSAYYVLLGDLASQSELSKLRQNTTSTALKAMGSVASGSPLSARDQKAVADLLSSAAVVPASALAEKR